MKTQQTYPPCDLLSSKTQLSHQNMHVVCYALNNSVGEAQFDGGHNFYCEVNKMGDPDT